MRDSEKNSHGSHAKVGDLVEVMTLHGKETRRKVRLVLGVQKTFSHAFRRFDCFLYLQGLDLKVRAENVNIVLRGSEWE